MKIHESTFAGKRFGKLILAALLVCGMSAMPIIAYADNEPAFDE